jgi:hypothetical protein
VYAEARIVQSIYIFWTLLDFQQEGDPYALNLRFMCEKKKKTCDNVLMNFSFFKKKGTEVEIFEDERYTDK